jgi:Domain of unknown function (DUF4440)
MKGFPMILIRRSLAGSALLMSLCLIAATPMMLAGQTPEITGKWIGSFDVVHADGSVEPGDAYIALARNGDTLSGSAGDRADKQNALSAGKVSGNGVKFDVVVNPQMTVHFDLVVEGDRLHGTASGLPAEPGAKIVVDAKRAGEDWKTASPIEHARDQLLDTVAALDKKLFDAYNTCDLATMGAMVSEDLEFYHDKTGLAVGRQAFLDAIKQNICGKTTRVVVPGTMEAHRLNGFGAMEMVTHRFQHPGHEEIGVGEAKSIMLWRLKDGQWMLTRVISYDHGAAKN